MFCLFSSLSEFYVYATCVLLGISVMMPMCALTSAPSYMVNYYKYATGNSEATPNSPVFWANILTFYNLVSIVTQSACGPTVLTPWARKLSLTLRFAFALTLMMLEVLVILVMPAGHVSQAGAMAAFFIVTIVAGMGKSYLEATCYALVGTMPSKFMSAMMFGNGLSGVISSVLQCIIKAAMESTYEGTLHQAYIYFSLALGFMAVALGMALCLRYNNFAREHVGEFRALKRTKAASDSEAGNADEFHAIDDGVHRHPDDHHHHNDSDERQDVQELSVAQPSPFEEVYGDAALEAKDKEEKLHSRGSDDLTDETKGRLPPASDEAMDENYEDDRHLTTSEQMQRTRVLPVIKLIWPVMLACFITFFISFFVFPSLIIPIDRNSKWFATIAILLNNCGDACGRVSTTFRVTWPSRKWLLIGVCCRFIFIPLSFLCIYKYIPGHAAPYVFFTLFGFTTGYFGAMSMVLGPADTRLRTEGQRVMAGQLMGISLLVGGSVSSLLALLVVLFLP